MNESGELIDWNDERGFGFVRTATGEKLFIHTSAFRRSTRRPEPGDRLAFSRGKGKDGRPAVALAVIAGATARHVRPSPDRIENAQQARMTRIAGAAILLAALMWARYGGQLPLWLLVAYLAMSVVSAALYWWDKRAANERRWRVAERTLHAVDLLGGIIGGLLAQAALHHKTAKASFGAITWAIAMLHLVGLALLATGIVGLS